MLAIDKAFLHKLALLCDHCLHTPSFARDVCKRCMYHAVSTRSNCSDKTFSFRESCPPHFRNVWGRKLNHCFIDANVISCSWHGPCCTDWSRAQWFVCAVLDEGLTLHPGCGCFTCSSRICTVSKNMKKEQHWNWETEVCIFFLLGRAISTVENEFASRLRSEHCSS